MDDELKKKLKALRLHGLIGCWDDYLKKAEKENLSYVKLLTHIIDEAYCIKQESAKQYRLRCAKIPELFRMEIFPFDRQPNLDQRKMKTLYDAGNYLNQPQNIIWIGPTGTGKTGLASAFLRQAIEKGLRGKFISFPDLIETLYQSVGDHSEAKVIRKFASYDMLLIDELGYTLKLSRCR